MAEKMPVSFTKTARAAMNTEEFKKYAEYLPPKYESKEEEIQAKIELIAKLGAFQDIERIPPADFVSKSPFQLQHLVGLRPGVVDFSSPVSEKDRSEEYVRKIFGDAGSESHHVCSKCHKKTIEVRVFHSRSLDEPSSSEFTCTSCGHRWRQM